MVIEFIVAVVIFSSWLLLIVYIHFIRQYGQSGFKKEMCNIYCSVKEVLSCLYILSHWVCMAIMLYLVIIDYKIDGNIVPRYLKDPNDYDEPYKYNYAWQSFITHDTTFAIWVYASLIVYFLAGISNTILAVELITDRGRIPSTDRKFARPDYIGQNMGWNQRKLRDPAAIFVGHRLK